MYADMSCCGKLNCIADEVDQALTQSCRVSSDISWDVFVYRYYKINSLFLSFVFIILFLFLLGLTGTLNTLQVIVVSVLISSQSLILLLVLGAFADNKVMGMAISKGFGILLMGPLLDFALPSPYNWIGAYSPLFWASRSFLADTHITFWLHASITFLFHLFLIWILFHKFIARSD